MNINRHLAAQHATYEADLEPDNYGLTECPLDDTTPWTLDDDTDITTTRPCNFCGNTDCACIDYADSWTMPLWGIWGG